MSRVQHLLQALVRRRSCRRAGDVPLNLNDHALRDIGLTRMDIERVLSKPVHRQDQ